MAKYSELKIKTWPQLLVALDDNRLALLGDTPAERAKYLIIEGIEARLRNGQKPTN